MSLQFLDAIFLHKKFLKDTYTLFKRMTSDRTKTCPFCVDLHSVVQCYIAWYAQIEVILSLNKVYFDIFTN